MSDALQQAQAAVQTPSLRTRLKEGMKDITAGTVRSPAYAIFVFASCITVSLFASDRRHDL
jgi:hypothetical protein